ncbi:MAG: hypothetical protein ACJ8EY_02180 [Sphingomicrobium sp.]
MRAVLLVLILAILALIAAMATGLINFNMTRGAKVPQVSATGNGVVAKGGEVPAFDVETGSVKVGVKETTVKVPTLGVEPAGAGNQAAPPPAQEPGGNASGL